MKVKTKRNKLNKKCKSRNKKIKGGNPSNTATAIVYTLKSDQGFFSVFGYMLRVYLFAKQRNVPFFIEHNNWQYTYKEGWHDYFKTLNVFDSNSKYTNIERYENKAEFTGSNVPLYTIKEYIDTIKEIFILNDNLQKTIDDYIKSIGRDYISIYVRRGDKNQDGPLPTVNEILSQTTIKDDGTPIFVQTDDYTVVEEMEKKFPSCKIFTLTDKSERGSSNRKLLEATPDYRKKNTDNFLSGCVIVSKSMIGWSYYDSNVGIFLKLLGYDVINLYIDKRTTKESIDSIMKLDHKGHPGFLKK
jgi:hypothetical protein